MQQLKRKKQDNNIQREQQQLVYTPDRSILSKFDSNIMNNIPSQLQHQQSNKSLLYDQQQYQYQQNYGYPQENSSPFRKIHGTKKSDPQGILLFQQMQQQNQQVFQGLPNTSSNLKGDSGAETDASFSNFLHCRAPFSAMAAASQAGRQNSQSNLLTSSKTQQNLSTNKATSINNNPKSQNLPQFIPCHSQSPFRDRILSKNIKHSPLSPMQQKQRKQQAQIQAAQLYASPLGNDRHIGAQVGLLGLGSVKPGRDRSSPRITNMNANNTSNLNLSSNYQLNNHINKHISSSSRSPAQQQPKRRDKSASLLTYETIQQAQHIQQPKQQSRTNQLNKLLSKAQDQNIQRTHVKNHSLYFPYQQQQQIQPPRKQSQVNLQQCGTSSKGNVERTIINNLFNNSNYSQHNHNSSTANLGHYSSQAQSSYDNNMPNIQQLSSGSFSASSNQFHNLSAAPTATAQSSSSSQSSLFSQAAGLNMFPGSSQRSFLQSQQNNNNNSCSQASNHSCSQQSSGSSCGSAAAHLSSLHYRNQPLAVLLSPKQQQEYQQQIQQQQQQQHQQQQQQHLQNFQGGCNHNGSYVSRTPQTMSPGSQMSDFTENSMYSSTLLNNSSIQNNSSININHNNISAQQLYSPTTTTHSNPQYLHRQQNHPQQQQQQYVMRSPSSIHPQECMQKEQQQFTKCPQLQKIIDELKDNIVRDLESLTNKLYRETETIMSSSGESLQGENMLQPQSAKRLANQDNRQNIYQTIPGNVANQQDEDMKQRFSFAKDAVGIKKKRRNNTNNCNFMAEKNEYDNCVLEETIDNKENLAHMSHRSTHSNKSSTQTPPANQQQYQKSQWDSQIPAANRIRSQFASCIQESMEIVGEEKLFGEFFKQTQCRENQEQELFQQQEDQQLVQKREQQEQQQHWQQQQKQQLLQQFIVQPQFHQGQYPYSQQQLCIPSHVKNQSKASEKWQFSQCEAKQQEIQVVKYLHSKQLQRQREQEKMQLQKQQQLAEQQTQLEEVDYQHEYINQQLQQHQQLPGYTMNQHPLDCEEILMLPSKQSFQQIQQTQQIVGNCHPNMMVFPNIESQQFSQQESSNQESMFHQFQIQNQPLPGFFQESVMNDSKSYPMITGNGNPHVLEVNSVTDSEFGQQAGGFIIRREPSAQADEEYLQCSSSGDSVSVSSQSLQQLHCHLKENNDDKIESFNNQVAQEIKIPVGDEDKELQQVELAKRQLDLECLEKLAETQIQNIEELEKARMGQLEVECEVPLKQTNDQRENNQSAFLCEDQSDIQIKQIQVEKISGEQQKIVLRDSKITCQTPTPKNVSSSNEEDKGSDSSINIANLTPCFDHMALSEQPHVLQQPKQQISSFDCEQQQLSSKQFEKINTQSDNHSQVSNNNNNINPSATSAVVSVPKAFVKPPVHGIKNLELLRKQPSYSEQLNTLDLHNQPSSNSLNKRGNLSDRDEVILRTEQTDTLGSSRSSPAVRSFKQSNESSPQSDISAKVSLTEEFHLNEEKEIIIEKQVILKEFEEVNQQQDGFVVESQNRLENSSNMREIREFKAEELNGTPSLEEKAENVQLSSVQGQISFIPNVIQNLVGNEGQSISSMITQDLQDDQTNKQEIVEDQKLIDKLGQDNISCVKEKQVKESSELSSSSQCSASLSSSKDEILTFEKYQIEEKLTQVLAEENQTDLKLQISETTQLQVSAAKQPAAESNIVMASPSILENEPRNPVINSDISERTQNHSVSAFSPPNMKEKASIEIIDIKDSTGKLNDPIDKADFKEEGLIYSKEKKTTTATALSSSSPPKTNKVVNFSTYLRRHKDEGQDGFETLPGMLPSNDVSLFSFGGLANKSSGSKEPNVSLFQEYILSNQEKVDAQMKENNQEEKQKEQTTCILETEENQGVIESVKQSVEGLRNSKKQNEILEINEFIDKPTPIVEEVILNNIEKDNLNITPQLPENANIQSISPLQSPKASYFNRSLVFQNSSQQNMFAHELEVCSSSLENPLEQIKENMFSITREPDETQSFAVFMNPPSAQPSACKQSRIPEMDFSGNNHNNNLVSSPGFFLIHENVDCSGSSPTSSPYYSTSNRSCVYESTQKLIEDSVTISSKKSSEGNESCFGSSNGVTSMSKNYKNIEVSTYPQDSEETAAGCVVVVDEESSVQGEEENKNNHQQSIDNNEAEDIEMEIERQNQDADLQDKQEDMDLKLGAQIQSDQQLLLECGYMSPEKTSISPRSLKQNDHIHHRQGYQFEDQQQDATRLKDSEQNFDEPSLHASVQIKGNSNDFTQIFVKTSSVNQSKTILKKSFMGSPTSLAKVKAGSVKKSQRRISFKDKIEEVNYFEPERKSHVTSSRSPLGRSLLQRNRARLEALRKEPYFNSIKKFPGIQNNPTLLIQYKNSKSPIRNKSKENVKSDKNISNPSNNNQSNTDTANVNQTANIAVPPFVTKTPVPPPVPGRRNPRNNLQILGDTTTGQDNIPQPLTPNAPSSNSNKAAKKISLCKKSNL